MDDQTKDVLDELEKAYQDTVGQAQTVPAVSNSTQNNLSDEKEKLKNLIETLNKSLVDKKTAVEAKLDELKNTKSQIEAGLQELRELEAKRSIFEEELKKIDKIELEEKAIEDEVLKMSL